MAISTELDRAQRRFPALGYPIAVVYKYFDDRGGYLSALITYYAFVSVVPTMLLATTLMSWILRDRPDWQAALLNSALSEFPVIGDQLKAPGAMSGNPVVITFGVIGALYGAQGVAQALQYAANTVWQVPRNSQPNPFLARGRSMLLMMVVGVGLILTTALGAFVDHLGLGGWAHAALVLGTVLINMLVFIFLFHFASAIELKTRQVVAGAVICGLGWYLLQNFGTTYVVRVIKHASVVNSVFAVVLGLLAYVYLAAVMVVLAMEIDVVRVRHLFPRALLTPFTDNVDLTDADVAAYTGQAKAQRAKGFQQIQVTFGERPDEHAENLATGKAAPGKAATGERGEDVTWDDGRS